MFKTVYVTERLVNQARAGGDCVRVGGTVQIPLKGGETEKRAGGQIKSLKRGGGQAGSHGVGALKRGSWNPLTNYELKTHSQKHDKILSSDFVLSEIEFEIGTHHLTSLNKKYSQQFHLLSGKLLATLLCELDMVS